jgi:hypothetical protein
MTKILRHESMKALAIGSLAAGVLVGCDDKKVEASAAHAGHEHNHSAQSTRLHENV